MKKSYSSIVVLTCVMLMFQSFTLQATNVISGFVYRDFDTDAVFDANDQGQAAVEIELYTDNNNNNIVDGGDSLLQTVNTIFGGGYTFSPIGAGNYALKVKDGALPPTTVYTTLPHIGVDFASTGETSPNNNFGYQGPSVSCILAADGGSNRVAFVNRFSNFVYTIPGAISDMDDIMLNQTGSKIFFPDDDNGGQRKLGDINPITGGVTYVANIYGVSGVDTCGSIFFGANDIEAATVNKSTNEMYLIADKGGSCGDPVMFKVDQTTGSFIPGAFANGADYVPIPVSSQVSGIAFHPFTNVLYASVNKTLITINPNTGDTSFINATVPSINLLGLAFASDGTCYGVESNSFYEVNITTGALTPLITTLPDGDYEGCDCLGLPMCINPPTLNLSSSSDSVCGLSAVTVTGNTFSNATEVTLTTDGLGTLTPSSSNTTPFSFTYTPVAGDVGNTIIVMVTTDNPSGPQCTVASETFTLKVLSTPAAYAVTGGGVYCSGGAGVNVGLANSDIGINYQLRIDGTDIGSLVAGTGSSIGFGFQDSTGNYTVVATNNINSCMSTMIGSVNVTEQARPTAYAVTGGGAYCDGGAGVAVGLANSEIGVTYELYRNGSPTGNTLAGTGSALDFGAQTLAGSYIIGGINDMYFCFSIMSGSASVIVNPNPTAYAVTGGGIYCEGDSGVVVGLADSESGINYQLKLDGTDTGSPLAGTGSALDFGFQDVAGNYTVQATNASTSCVTTMTGSVNATELPAPTAYVVTGGGVFCSGGAGVKVGLSNSDSGFNYQLKVDGIDTGSPLAGTGSALDFGFQDSTGNYTVVAINTTTSCTAIMTGSVNVTEQALPTAYAVTGGGGYCDGATGVPIGLASSETGVTYELYKDGSPTGNTLAGTGSALDFGIQTLAGSYFIVGINDMYFCFKVMSGSVSVTINPNPTAYAVTGGGAYCSGGAGVAVGLANSESGVNYQLQLNGTDTGSPVAGTGSAISFGNQTAVGNYTVVATNGTTTCVNTMTGDVDVTTNALVSQVGSEEFECVANSPHYTVRFVLNGTAPYTITGSGAAGGTLVADTFTTANINVNANYSISIDDANACNTFVISGNAPTNCNKRPIAINDIANGIKNDTLIGNVIVNDSDPDGDNLSTSVLAGFGPFNGSLTLNSDGTYEFIPSAAFTGEDVFQYVLCDTSSACDTATVNIEVFENTINNDAPIANADVIKTFENPETGSTNLLANDFDVDGKNIMINTTPVSLPTNGTVTIISSGYAEYTPNASFIGEDVFTYSMCDDGTPALCDTAIVTVYVTVDTNNLMNDAPNATDDAFYISANLNATGNVLTNDSDPNRDEIYVNLALSPILAPSYGSVTLLADGDFVYIPNTNFVGTDYFTYQVCDTVTPAACAEATVIISVDNVNLAPLAVNDINVTSVNEAVSGTVQSNDVDAENDPFTSQMVANPSNGFVTLNPLGLYTYTPLPNFTGNDVFTYQLVEDATGRTSNVAQVTITVKSTPDYDDNEAPYAINDNVTMPQNVTVTFNLTANDFDPESDSLFAAGPFNGPGVGTATISSNGAIEYVPQNGYVGVITFDYQVCDNGKPVMCDTATVTINVEESNGNNPPIAIDDVVDMLENDTANFNVTFNDFEPDAELLTVSTSPITGPFNGSVTILSNGDAQYIPNTNYVGSDYFVYEVCDNLGKCRLATVYIIVNTIPDSVCISTKVFMEGAFYRPYAPYNMVAPYDFSVSSMNMFTDLVTGNCGVILPTSNPFQSYPQFGYTGTDSLEGQPTNSDVDWILLSFRKGKNKVNEFFKQAVILEKDGSIRTVNNKTCVLVPLNDGDSVLTVVESLSHLGVMVKYENAITEGSVRPVDVDFRYNQGFNETLSNNGGMAPTSQQAIGTDANGFTVYAMTGGNFDNTYSIDAGDVSIIQNKIGIIGLYHPADNNLDCDVNPFDFSLVFSRLGNFSSVNSAQ